MSNTYKLLDSGNQKKLEVFGEYTFIRPCPQAMWEPFAPKLWQKFDAEFVRNDKETGKWRWMDDNNVKIKPNRVPTSWQCEALGLNWQIEPNEFGNLGVFTEHWTYLPTLQRVFSKPSKILNLFSYAGSSCMPLIRDGHFITAVDSSKSAMDLYTQNLQANNLSREGQKIILEDVLKFTAREIRRESLYDGILLDAPSYGRGTKGEVFKIEEDLVSLLKIAKQLMAKNGKLILTLHSPRFTPALLQILVSQAFPKKTVTSSEILNPCESGVSIPSGFLVVVE